MVLPQRHLITVSQTPRRCGLRFLTMDKASEFLLRALEAVSSCECMDGCENCEPLAYPLKRSLTNDDRYYQRSL